LSLDVGCLCWRRGSYFEFGENNGDDRPPGSAALPSTTVGGGH
jgi:hypothetical protein